MPLTNLNDVKSYLGISQTDISDDNFLNLLVNSVQATIEKYCHRHFDVNTYTSEQHIINHKIFTREYPIISVSSIVRTGENSLVSPDTGLITNYRLFPSSIDLLDYKNVTMTNRLRYSNIEESYVQITYTAGFSTPPADLSLAAIKLVAMEYKESREDRIGKESEKEGSYQATYFKKETEMPLNISSVLDRYKKVSL